MKRSDDIVLTKRDGSAERFGLAKLVGCLRRALRGRAYDPRLAGPLARAVEMHLHEWSDAAPPTTDYVFRCLCAALDQTGLGDVAEDLHNFRRLRSMRRQRTRVLDEIRSVLGRGEPWCKSALVATLQNEYGLRSTVARFLAGQIELRVFSLNYRIITRSFLAELVRNEVLAWGLADALWARPAAIAAGRSDGPAPAREGELT